MPIFAKYDFTNRLFRQTYSCANSTNKSINNRILITTFTIEKTEKNTNEQHKNTSFDKNRQPRISITTVDTLDNSMTMIVKQRILDLFAQIYTNNVPNNNAH